MKQCTTKEEDLKKRPGRVTVDSLMIDSEFLVDVRWKKSFEGLDPIKGEVKSRV